MLTFKTQDLKPIVAHALASAEHTPTYAMQLDPAHWKPGVKVAPGVWPKPADIDRAKIAAHLQLVKDTGVYLMSSGAPRLIDQSVPGGLRSVVAYADGLGLEDGWDAWQAVSGDDFVEQVDVLFIKKAIDLGASTIRITLTESSLSIDFDLPKGAPSRWVRR